MPIAPGATIGIIGGGQLGRMMAQAAARMGYRCHILDPHEAPCAAEVSDRFTRADFDDEEALRALGEACDAVTYEFENVPVAPLGVLGAKLTPGTRSLEVAQDRAVEKRFIEQCGAKVARWHGIDGTRDIVAAIAELGAPVLIKTRRLGYDGKGQVWVHAPGDAEAAWDEIGHQPAVAEARVAFDSEFSLVIARSRSGEVRAFPPARNHHEGGILRLSTVPAGPDIDAHAELALGWATAIANALDHVGVLTVEFFATPDGPLVNEIAPRVHNSGHWTIEGAFTSQFEQHLRCVLDLPLGDASLVAAGAKMENLIGTDVERWADFLGEGNAAFHLYNKGEARAGRKMGHITRVTRGA
ncbi:5-(carboxyamino)imidazole ribonucleotide synthase [Sphingomonas xanthus]|uniref:N5-carboxyaminoimidazole ribonucleotide synthase n=1 Tax=Sphingomonas xanthus TaxID=2594473 RepID=A0A516IRZ6_9SPHN|nr:5-(carboxyamino)imidazole ribonucleotide synthase [Sphingomonas xanthus]QDP19666.1 5-(carboxyamino)imidazole ribonucleotide synthase [Sphingomonas xanthus]